VAQRPQKASPKKRSRFPQQSVETLRRALSRERALRKQALEREREALEQQTATADILRVMSGSPSDVQPVFDAVARKTSELCSGSYAIVVRFDGELIHLVAQHNARPGASAPTAQHFPRPPGRDTSAGRAVLERAIVHIPHADKDPELSQEFVRRIEAGSFLAVPLLREGKVIGAIGVSRAESGPFPTKQIELVKVFADQAVIAIENARLFNETKEALERQRATSEVLGVISSSPTDVAPVYRAILDNVTRLCEAKLATLFLYDGEFLTTAAHCNATPDLGRYLDGLRIAPSLETPSRRAALERRIVHVEDALSDPSFSLTARHLRERFRTVLSVPLLREGELAGVITIWRREPRLFSDQQVALVKTFADQAVIAIENVRLFNETREALEQQTATAEILRVISSTPTDAQPVFDAIVKSGLHVFAGAGVGIVIDKGDCVRVVAAGGVFDPMATKVSMPRSRDSASGAAIVDGRMINVADTEAADAPPYARDNGRALGFRAIAAAPMLREGHSIGALVVVLKEPGGLTEKQLQLLKTFADQAVIAIENVRLFKELQERTEALTKSVDQLTALGEVGQAISSTLDLETVLKTIVSRAVQLTGMNGGSIYEFDELTREFHLRAAENMPDDVAEVYRRMPIRLGEGIVGGAAARREPVQVPDIQEPGYQTRYRELLLRQGYRAILAVPLLREEQIIGALTVSRKEPGAFAPEVVELLKTFATQSALAIQNARLFRELAEKSRELEVASRHKSQFLASMSHELRTPLNAILGFNEMILGQIYGEVPQDMQEPLEDIQKSGKHLLRLINNVLDLAKIEAGRMELALADYSVQDTVDSVRSTLRPLAEAKGLDLVASVSEDIPLAYGDGGRLTQCLMNLAGNSLKFTKQGRVEIAVDAKDGRLTWRVSDTGIGIPPDKIPTLFSEFKQTDATIASEYGGTGLGLSITKKFVEMHGGRIWVESELGSGSAFIFEVPLRVTTA
jgi:signal transduction histidine kinase